MTSVYTAHSQLVKTVMATVIIDILIGLTWPVRPTTKPIIKYINEMPSQCVGSLQNVRMR